MSLDEALEELESHYDMTGGEEADRAGRRAASLRD
jgi:hypothetical protein